MIEICVICKRVLIKNYGAEPNDVLPEKFWRWMIVRSELIKLAKENNALIDGLCPDHQNKKS